MYLVLGTVWMAAMGFLVVAVNAVFFNNLSLMADEPVLLSLRPGGDGLAAAWWAAAAGVGLWLLVAGWMYVGSARAVPALLGAVRPDQATMGKVLQAVDEAELGSGSSGKGVRFFLLETQARNAFACGRDLRNGSVVLTRGLVEELEPGELRAVIGHELAHLANGDAAFAVQAMAFAWVVVAVAMSFFWAVAAAAVAVVVMGAVALFIINAVGDDDVVGCFAVAGAAVMAVVMVVAALYFLAAYALVVACALGLVALGVRGAASAVSHSREYLADACAAQWTRAPMDLVSALRKVAGQAHPNRISSALVAPLWLHLGALESGRPWAQRLFWWLFSSHPSLDRRLNSLNEMTPVLERGGNVVQEARRLVAGSWRRRFELAGPMAFSLVALTGVWGGVVVVQQWETNAGRRPARAAATARRPAAPAPVLFVGRVEAEVLNVRAEPSVQARRIGQLRRGARVEVRGERGGWYMISWPAGGSGRVGWVAEEYVAREAATPMEPRSPASTPPPTPTTADSFGTGTRDGAPVRSETVDPGQPATVVQRVEQLYGAGYPPLEFGMTVREVSGALGISGEVPSWERLPTGSRVGGVEVRELSVPVGRAPGFATVARWGVAEESTVTCSFTRSGLVQVVFQFPNTTPRGRHAHVFDRFGAIGGLRLKRDEDQRSFTVTGRTVELAAAEDAGSTNIRITRIGR